MRYFPITLVFLCAVTAADAAELEVRSDIDSVTVYPDSAAVTRIIRVDLSAGDTVTPGGPPLFEQGTAPACTRDVP